MSITGYNGVAIRTSTFWAEPTEYTTPVTTAPTGGWNVGTLADYFGIPTGVSGLKVNSLPFRAYCKVWNEWFRDENLQQPVTQSMDDTTTAGVNTGTNLSDAEAGGLPLKVCKYKDYFTSCLPSPQKSAEPVRLPMVGNAPIKLYYPGKELTKETRATGLGTAGGSGEYKADQGIYAHIGNKNDTVGVASGRQTLWFANGASGGSAFMGADLSNVTGATINELRQAIAVQHIFERDARTGTRYKEILKGAWGVTSPDARLDRSEYIGGHRMPINVNQVIQTSSTDSTSPQGNTGAYSMTTLSRNMCTYSATEHGFVLGLAAIRVDHSYQQGLSRLWTRSTRFSYYDPMLANLGEQAVLNQEIYAQGKTQDEEVFGYQEAWADYRYRTNMVTSEMRSTYAQTLDAWHYADKYNALPALSSSWIKEGTENIDRTLAVQSSNSHQFICNFYYSQAWTRPIPIYSIPGIDTI